MSSQSAPADQTPSGSLMISTGREASGAGRPARIPYRCTPSRRAAPARRALLLVAVLVAVMISACNPTGHSACDQQVLQRKIISAHGWTLDCTPPSHLAPHQGWADKRTRTVYVWADLILAGRNTGRSALDWVLWHETAHVIGIWSEWDADLFADRMTA